MHPLLARPEGHRERQQEAGVEVIAVDLGVDVGERVGPGHRARAKCVASVPMSMSIEADAAPSYYTRYRASRAGPFDLVEQPPARRRSAACCCHDLVDAGVAPVLAVEVREHGGVAVLGGVAQRGVVRVVDRPGRGGVGRAEQVSPLRPRSSDVASSTRVGRCNTGGASHRRIVDALDRHLLVYRPHDGRYPDPARGTTRDDAVGPGGQPPFRAMVKTLEPCLDRRIPFDRSVTVVVREEALA